ncbi:Cupredoxin [Glomus cerebriforme]|uniref:Cupredoxin n=1 Tax=Glomus cerebriforme TaxID=658196 RepID=A0A397S415_9GLOM|nr:Cupredoxin [Glomus cerebriforme]
MKETLAIFLLLAGLVTISHTADVTVNVGNVIGANVFEPATVMANVGDNVIFNWVSGIHSVIESDAEAACVKSAKPDAFASGGAFAAPKQFTVPAKAAGKTWFYCGVPGHCAGGMYGTLIIADGTAPAGGAPAGGAMPPAAGGAPAGGAMPPAAGGAPAGGAMPPAAGGAPAGGAMPPAGGVPAGGAMPPAVL